MKESYVIYTLNSNKNKIGYKIDYKRKVKKIEIYELSNLKSIVA